MLSTGAPAPACAPAASELAGLLSGGGRLAAESAAPYADAGGECPAAPAPSPLVLLRLLWLTSVMRTSSAAMLQQV